MKQQVSPSSSSWGSRLSKTIFWAVAGALIVVQTRRVLQPYPHVGRRQVDVALIGLPSSSMVSSFSRTTNTVNDDPLTLPSLRFDWSNLALISPLAKMMEAHQTNCQLPLGDLRMRNTAGLGSDLHVWTQALCNGMQDKVRVVTHGPWIFRDSNACAAATASTNHHDTTTRKVNQRDKDDALAMLCYFPHSEVRCPQDRLMTTGALAGASSTDRVQLNSANKNVPRLCHKIRETHNLTFSDVRAAGVEYLFARTGPVIIQEARRQLRLLFGDIPPHPSQLITVHIRWGDKINDMELRPIDEYVTAVQKLAAAKNLQGSDVYVFLASEDPLAVQGFLDATKVHGWTIAVDAYFQEFQTFRDPSLNGNPHMAKNLQGRPGLVALASVLVALQANDFVLTTRSNWSRLLNELRKAVIDPRCGSCTQMIDLTQEEFEW